MRLLKLKNIFLVAVLICISAFSFSVKAANAVSFPVAPQTISLTSPAQGQVIISSGLVISGKAPTGVIVTVTIQDEDYQKAFQVHETNLITNGTTTSDRNGDWVYVPSKNLVPGRYSAIASFQADNNGSISSDKSFFTVSDEAGATSWFSIPGLTLVLIIAVVVIALLILIFRIMGGRSRRLILHTTWGDIPVKEIIDENNNVEIVPIAEPMINLGPQIQQIQSPIPQQNYMQPNFQQVQPNYVQPTQMTANYPQATLAPIQQPIQPVYQQQQSIIQPAPVMQPPVQIYQQPNIQPTNIVRQPVQNPQSAVRPTYQQPVQQNNQNIAQIRPVITTTRAQLLNT